MKFAIVFDSNTGNTKMIAEAIKEELSEEDVLYFGKPGEVADADVYIVGSWTEKGMCTPKIGTFLESLRQKKIALFGTAGYGGSEDYYASLVERIKGHLDESNVFLGWFYCQGKMPMAVRSRYEKMMTEHPEDRKLQVSLDNFDAALSHPDGEDLVKAKKWIRGILEELGK
ncbi:MAG: flavodoxin family protein [Tissierellia bacterium]|nr:flavodoxin family protein [Tissierellia bacterium]